MNSLADPRSSRALQATILIGGRVEDGIDEKAGRFNDRVPAVRPTRILLVEDSPTKGLKVCRDLESAGFEVTLAHDGQQGLEHARRERPDAIVSDILMPRLDGFELCQAVREDADLKDMPVVLVTSAFDKPDDREFALKIGADGYFEEQQMDASELALTIRNAIVQRRGAFKIELHWTSKSQHVHGTDTFQQEHAERLRSLAAAKVDELQQSYEELGVAYHNLLEGLIRALDLRDTDTELHSWRVSEYSLFLAKRAGLGWDALTDIERGALLHDIGKIGISDAILRKPAALNEAEWVEMRKHPQLGYDMLTGIDFLQRASEIVLAHHERWDGAGYPRGLSGDSIPVGARIFALADTIDAITSDRPYRAGATFEDAMKEVEAHAGTQFDPGLVELVKEIEPDAWRSIRTGVELKRNTRRSLGS